MKTLSQIDQERAISALKKMLLIRHFELRAEASYLQGEIGGFFHAYIGQEAIQTAAVDACGLNHWWITSYRCHALALLLGVHPNALMAELYGRANGNAKGRGGSMHLYTDRLLGGFGIVAGQIPTATGAAFALKYQDIKDQIAICFLGDGAVAQGAFHESLNLASLWNLPCLYVIENNRWGMGTAVEKAVAAKRLAEEIAPAYRMKGYTLDGMDYLACYDGFKRAFQEILSEGRPILIEAITERFKGHSISDPSLYRSRESVKAAMQRDPLLILSNAIGIGEARYKEYEKEAREIAIMAAKYAEESPWPNPLDLEEGVFAPKGV